MVYLYGHEAINFADLFHAFSITVLASLGFLPGSPDPFDPQNPLKSNSENYK